MRASPLLAFTLLLLSALSFTSSSMADDQDAIEEIVVTGSYIKREDPFDSSSPLRVFDDEYILQQGNTDLAYILLDLPYVMGSNARPGLGGGNLDGIFSTPLRGLGGGTTLRLIDGKRTGTTGGDLLPAIAIKRVETLLDGASALYGTDAIAGVINFITKDDFEGVELQVTHMNDNDTESLNESNVSVMWGKNFDRGYINLAMEWFSHDMISLNERDLPAVGDSLFGKTYRFQEFANPSAAGVDPAFAAAYSGFAGFVADLNCADDPGGIPGHSGFACGANYGAYYPVSSAVDRTMVRLGFELAITDDVSLYGNYASSRQDTFALTAEFPWAGFQPVIPPFNPGLIEDARRRGVPEGTPLHGIAFLGRKLLGVPGNQVATAPGSPPLGIADSFSDSERFLIGLEGGLPKFESWSWDASLLVNRIDWGTNGYDNLFPNVIAALNGLGGPTCDVSDPVNRFNAFSGQQNVDGSGCFFYNPFLNAEYTAAGDVQTDPGLINSYELLAWMGSRTEEAFKVEQTVFDVVATGDLLPFNGNMIELAFGAHWRPVVISNSVNADWEAGNYIFSGRNTRFRDKRTVTAFFAELAVPLNDRLDVQLAARYERYREESLSSSDPKVSVRYRMTDEVSLRASYSTAFRAPDIPQVKSESINASFQNVSDPANGGATTGTPVITRGNPDLGPYQADVLNVGFSWYPLTGMLDGFKIDADYFSLDYKDLVITEVAQAVVNADPFGPNVTRDSSGLITLVETSFVNAGGSSQSGIELGAGYNWPTDVGNFGLRVDALRLTDMTLNLFDNSCECIVAIDGLGRRNHDNAFGAVQDLKVNTTLSWAYKRHSAALTWRYLSDYENSGQGTPVSTQQLAADRGYECTNDDGSANTTGAGCPIDDHLTLDVRYSYELPPLGRLSTPGTVILGLINATDEEPPAVAMDMGYDVTSHDPRGRLWYARYSLRL